MKGMLIGSFFAVGFCLASGTSARAGQQDFTLYNQTGVEIDELYISPHEEDDWEEDVLGDDTLPANDNVRIRFAPDEDVDDWDIRIVDAKGRSMVWEKLELGEIAEVTLYFENGKAWAEVEP